MERITLSDDTLEWTIETQEVCPGWKKKITAKAPKVDPLPRPQSYGSRAVPGDEGHEDNTPSKEVDESHSPWPVLEPNPPKILPPAPRLDSETLWGSREFPGWFDISIKTIFAAIKVQRGLGLLKGIPIAERARTRVRDSNAVGEYLAKGGTITQLPRYKFSKVSKDWKKLNGLPDYVFSTKAAKHADNLRKRAERGYTKLSEVQAGRIFLGLITEEEAKEQSKRDAQEEWDWLVYRALPKQYEPIRALACDARTIRSNVPWDFEGQFLDRLFKGREADALGDVFSEDQNHDLVYDHDETSEPDYMELEEEYEDDKLLEEPIKPSASIHDLVRPGYTNSLDRLFGQEVDQKELMKDGLAGASWGTKKAWSTFADNWNDALKELRLEEIKEREEWRVLSG